MLIDVAPHSSRTPCVEVGIAEWDSASIIKSGEILSGQIFSLQLYQGTESWAVPPGTGVSFLRVLLSLAGHRQAPLQVPSLGSNMKQDGKVKSEQSRG